KILALDPSNVGAMKQMAGLYRTTQQWQTLGEILTRLVSMIEDSQERADVLAQLGGLYEERFGQPEKAADYYRQALQTSSGRSDALPALERIYREQGDWKRLLEVLQRRASAEGEGPEALAIKL